MEGGAYAQGQPIIPNWQGQTLAESVILSSSVLCGTVGFVFITRATKQVAKFVLNRTPWKENGTESGNRN